MGRKCQNQSLSCILDKTGEIYKMAAIRVIANLCYEIYFAFDKSDSVINIQHLYSALFMQGYTFKGA